MTELQKIDMRLGLFGQYLKYRIDAKFTQLGFTYTPQYILDELQNHGFSIKLRDIGVPLLSFEQWLVLYDMAELAVNPEIITIGTNPMMQVVKYSGTTTNYEMLGSYDFLKSMDKMLNDYYN